MRESLDVYDLRPEAMNNYLRYNGRHFSKKLCNWAVSLIPKKFQVITKTLIDELMKNNNLSIEQNQLYDYVYVANYAKAYYYGSSISDELHLVKYVKDVIDSAYDGLEFNRWYADMCSRGIPIDWSEVL